MKRFFYRACGEWTRARVIALTVGLSAVALGALRRYLPGQARVLTQAQNMAFLAMILAIVWYASRGDEFTRRCWSLSAVFGFIAGVVALSGLPILRAAGIYRGTLGDPMDVFLVPFAVALAFFAVRSRWRAYDE